jgi:hypothetical protein
MLVLVKPQRDERSAIERVAGDGICAVLLEPWDDVLDVEDGAGGRADRVLERLQRQRAVRKRQPLEGVFALACGDATCSGVLSDLSAPFRARDVQLVRIYAQRQRLLSATSCLLLPIVDAEHSIARSLSKFERGVRRFRRSWRPEIYGMWPPTRSKCKSSQRTPTRTRLKALTSSRSGIAMYQNYGKFIASPIYCGKNTPIYAHYHSVNNFPNSKGSQIKLQK